MAKWYLRFAGVTFFSTWLGACLKVTLVFCGIVLVRICTPRFGLGAVTRLAWGSLLVYILAFFLVYLLGLLWF